MSFSVSSNTPPTKRCGFRAHEAPLAQFIKIHFGGREEELSVCAPCRLIRQADEKKQRDKKKAAALAASDVEPKEKAERFDNVPVWQVDPAVVRSLGVVRENPWNWGWDHVSKEMAKFGKFGHPCDCGCRGGD